MNSYSTLSDEQLADLLNNRDVSAYNEVFERYWYVMFQFARRFIQNNVEAEDIVQDSFLRMYNNMGVAGYFKHTLKSWLYTTVKHRALDVASRDKYRQKYSAYLAEYLSTSENTTEEIIAERELRDIIEQEVARMPEMVRTIFELSRNQYLSRKQIAEATSLPEEKVKKQLAKALRILKGRLGAYFFFQVMMALLWLSRQL